MSFNNIWIKPLIIPWYINHPRKDWQSKTIKYFLASKILRLMQFPITFFILIKEIIKHL